MSNQQVTVAGPARPPMDPASGLRRIKLRPHEMSDTITAKTSSFLLISVFPASTPRSGGCRLMAWSAKPARSASTT